MFPDFRSPLFTHIPVLEWSIIQMVYIKPTILQPFNKMTFQNLNQCFLVSMDTMAAIWSEII